MKTVQSVARAPSVRSRAGVVTVKLQSRVDKLNVMHSKRKLRYTEAYYDVYIDEQEHHFQQRLEHKIQMLVENLQHGAASGVPAMHYGTYNRRRQHNRQ